MDLNRTALTAVRIGALALAGIAATAGVSWAASHGVPTTGTTPTVTRVAPPAPLVVPDVRKLAFVFAKGELEDAGFAWTVAGSVHGYAANTVVSQTPAPGTGTRFSTIWRSSTGSDNGTARPGSTRSRGHGP